MSQNDGANVNEADLLHSIGQSYEKSNDYENALQYFSKALEARRKIFDDKHPDIAESLYCIGVCYEKLGNVDKALENHKNSYEMRKNLYENPNHPEIAESLHRIGKNHMKINEPEIAIDYFKQAIKIDEVVYPSNHHDLVELNNDIGEAYEALGDLSSALFSYKQANKTGTRNTVTENKILQLADTTFNKAIKFFKEADYLKALENFKTSHDVYAESYVPKENPKLANCLDYIGICYNKLANYDESIKYLDRAFDIRKKLYPKEHQDIALSFQSLAHHYESIGDIKQAHSYKIDSFKIRQKLLDHKHPDYATSLNNLGVSYQKMGNLKKALECINYAFEKRKDIYKDIDHQDLANSLHNLGVIHEKLGDLTSALGYFKRSYEMREKLFSNHDHPDMADSLSSLGIIYDKFGELAKAKDYDIKAYEMRERLYKTDHPDKANSLYNLGVVYEKLGETNKSMDYFSKSYEMRKSLLKDKHKIVNSLVKLSTSSKTLKNNELDSWNYKQVLTWFRQNKIHYEITRSLLNENASGSTLRQFYKMSIEAPEQFTKTILIGTNNRVGRSEIEDFKTALNKLCRNNQASEKINELI